MKSKKAKKVIVLTEVTRKGNKPDKFLAKANEIEECQEWGNVTRILYKNDRLFVKESVKKIYKLISK